MQHAGPGQDGGEGQGGGQGQQGEVWQQSHRLENTFSWVWSLTGSRPYPEPVRKVTKAGTVGLLVVFFAPKLLGVHISSRGPEPVPWGIIGRWPRGSGVQAGGLPFCRCGHGQHGGMQRRPAECERLQSTSAHEVFWDVTIFSLSPRGGVHRTSVKEPIRHGAPGIVKIPLILGCAGLVQGSPPSVLTSVP